MLEIFCIFKAVFTESSTLSFVEIFDFLVVELWTWVENLAEMLAATYD